MDGTTDPSLRSFIEVSPRSHFPIQNLPYSVFIPRPGENPRVGVAIGDWVLDLALLEEHGMLRVSQHDGAGVFNQPSLNAFMALGLTAWREVRREVTRLLRHDVAELRDHVVLRDTAFWSATDVEMCLPCRISDYTDFYCSEAHARNVGRIFRGEAEPPPNFRHMPIAYHGRASSIVVSGTEIHRPRGQIKPVERDTPGFGPTRELDFELEVGALIGPGNKLGQPISIYRAADHIFGLVLVNDWSARDIQQWEYRPLGPFAGKNFATTISPWVVPLGALEPFRCDGPLQEPPPLEYLRRPGPQAFNIHLEVALQTARMEAPATISRTSFREMYWSLEQMIAHHTAGGCNLRTGDLLASGTVSGTTPDSCGSLLELSGRSQRPLQLPNAEHRGFLEDGDTVTLTGYCQGAGYRVGFGECRGRIAPAGT